MLCAVCTLASVHRSEQLAGGLASAIIKLNRPGREDRHMNLYGAAITPYLLTHMAGRFRGSTELVEIRNRLSRGLRISDSLMADRDIGRYPFQEAH